MKSAGPGNSTVQFDPGINRKPVKILHDARNNDSGGGMSAINVHLMGQWQDNVVTVVH